MADILARLDVDPSEEMQSAIVNLIYKTFIPTQTLNADVQYRRIAEMARHSRLAALNFHRFIYTNKHMSMEEAGAGGVHGRVTLAIVLVHYVRTVGMELAKRMFGAQECRAMQVDMSVSLASVSSDASSTADGGAGIGFLVRLRKA